MALICSKSAFLKLFFKKNKNINNLLESVSQCFATTVVQDKSVPSGGKLNKAVEEYIKKSRKYDEFLKEQLKEYELGKKHLAGMMGIKGKEITQSDIDEAIEYLFPSALFSHHARPKFQEPEVVFQKSKPAQFDETGRPFHFLYYTCKPNYSQMLHDGAMKLHELQKYETQIRKAGMVNSEHTLSVSGEVWLSKEELEKKLLEKLHVLEYENFLELFTRLLEHPYSYLAEDMIKTYRKKIDFSKEKSLNVALPGEDGIMHSTVNSTRKTSRAVVEVSYPGNGKLEINSMGLDYFRSTLAREQVLFPLLFSEMVGKVDVKATVNNGGEMSQSGAIRYGIAQGLVNFVSREMVAKMKLAGLLQKDFRRTERKKVGREGARRGYTWLKR